MTTIGSPSVPQIFTLGLALALSMTTLRAQEHDTPGSLVAADSRGNVVEMPLRHTRVEVEISAFVARVNVEQVFSNPFDYPVEAVYVFPLGDRAAVDDFELTVGLRTIRGEIQRREEARRTYEEARDQGYRAALVEQQRENIFLQSVSNLMPGDEIRVRLRTIEVLEYKDGAYQFVFPLVVGPRYIPGDSLEPSLARTDSVAEPERISPPVLGTSERSGHDVEITATIDAGVPIRSVSSPSHRVEIRREAPERAVVRLAPDDRIPNKDFILSWDVSSAEPAVGVLAHRTGVDGFFSLIVQPEGVITPEQAAPKEIILVLDTSGSMSGRPIEASKSFASEALRSLGDRDTFNVVQFANGTSTFRKESQDSSELSVEQGVRWIRKVQGGGGTEMIKGLKTALSCSSDPDRFRMIVFLTDGFVGNDDRIVALIKALPDDIRVFTVGIGSSVNHSLLRRMAEAGNGDYVFIPDEAEAARSLERFRAWVTHPYLTDIEIDWGALPVFDAVPEIPGDLFSGQTLEIVGRYVGGARGDVVVRGKLAGRYWEKTVSVVLPEAEPAHEALGAVWARHRIGELLELSPGTVGDEIREEIVALAIEHRLLSPFTSFVAVDYSTRANDAEPPVRVDQAVPLPEGAFAEDAGDAMIERVVVQATANLVDLEEARSTARFSDEFIQDLPIEGRFFTNVLTLAPGVQDPDGDGNPNVHGTRERDFKTMVGGIENHDPLTGLRLSNLNLDAIDDVEVVTAGAGVAYGRAQGGFANIIEKQGTNQFEGLFEISHGSHLLDGSGATGLDREEVPEFDWSELSFQVSGPMIKDRLWYRLSYQGISGEDPVNTVGSVALTTTRQTTGSGSITWQASRRNKLSLGFLHDPIEVDGAEIDSTDPVRATAAVESGGPTYRFVWTAPLSPKLLVVTTVARRETGLSVRPDEIVGECVAGTEELGFGRCLDVGTARTWGPFFTGWQDASEIFTVRSDVDLFGSTFWGANHTFRLGFVVEMEEYGRSVARADEMDLIVDESEPGGERGRVIVRTAAAGGPYAETEGAAWSLYAEDTLRIRSDLTVTVGVRVDRESVRGADTVSPQGASAYSASDATFLREIEVSNTNPAPSLAVSWDPFNTGKTKVGVTAARRYGRTLPAVSLMGLEPLTVDLTFAASNRGEGWRIDGPCEGDCPPPTMNATVVDPDLRTPYADEYTLSLEREIAAETSLAVWWVRRDHRDQYFMDTTEAAGPPATGAAPEWGEILFVTNLGEFSYRGVTLEVERRQYRNWQMNASYTWSEMIGNGPWLDPLTYGRRLIEQEADGFLASDQRHVLKVAATVIVPWAGGFRFGGAVQWQSGLPFSYLERRVSLEETPYVRMRYVDGSPNEGRNEGWLNVDLHVAKEWALRGGVNLQLTLDVFNLFNDDALRVARFVDGFPVATRRYGRHTVAGVRLAF